jgi:D-sedoheptulose 7-phosphate isomerase
MRTVTITRLRSGLAHVTAVRRALDDLRGDVERIQRWGTELAGVLEAGGRLLAAGNGGSSAQAHHLTSELVGRYREERRPYSALCLSADSSSVTAIANDYGVTQMFARQVEAHGRPGDVLVLLSTSGRSPNVLEAVDAARCIGLTIWGLTGRFPNPLAERCDDALGVRAAATATVQEVHQVVIHLLCAEVDAELGVTAPGGELFS